MKTPGPTTGWNQGLRVLMGLACPAGRDPGAERAFEPRPSSERKAPNEKQR
jgi:hypothetical protein